MIFIRTIVGVAFMSLSSKGSACLLAHLMTSDMKYMIHVSHSTPACLNGNEVKTTVLRVEQSVAFDIEVLPVSKEKAANLPVVMSISGHLTENKKTTVVPRVRAMEVGKYFVDNIVFSEGGKWTFELALKLGTTQESTNFELKVEAAIPKIEKVLPDQFVPAFKMKDISGQEISRESLRSKVWLAQYFFTSCPTICPVMTAKMASLQKEFKDFPEFRSVSVTTDPATDTMEAIKKFANLHHADLTSWYFLRGTKEEMIALSKGGLDLGGDLKSPAHSVQFALIDRNGKIRGRYDPTIPAEMKELRAGLSALLAKKK